METISATEVRKKWSETCDNAAWVRPSFIKRTRDVFMFANSKDMIKLLSYFKFVVEVYKEKKGITLVLKDMDLAAHGNDLEEACHKIAEDILEYAEEYYENYHLYSNAPNRSDHLPYVIKALLLNDAEKIQGEIICQDGQN